MISYLKHDIRLLFKNKSTIIFFILLSTIAVGDTLYTFITQSKFFDSLDQMSGNWYIFLDNTGSMVREFYFLIFPIIVSFPFGFQYYYEMKSGYKGILMARSSRISYFNSKIITCFISGFMTIFFFLIINFVMVYIMYNHTTVIGGAFLEPDDGAFLSEIFYKDAYIYQFIYILLNSIVGGIISTFSMLLSMIIDYKNQVYVIVVPFIVCKLQTTFLFFINPHYDIFHIIQPFTRFALVKPITTSNIVLTLFVWIVVESTLVLLIYKKERYVI